MAEAVTKGFHSMVYLTANEPWELMVEPFKVAPRVYYVGNRWVGAYLIDCKEGLILIDTMTSETVYLLFESIRKLGFDPHDIKHILLSHCHCDHVYGARIMQEYSGAKVWLSKTDYEFIEHPANKEMDDTFRVVPYRVDEFYDDEQPIRLGDVVIRTRLTPGHTPGTTSFFIDMPDENGKILTMAMHGGVGTLTFSPKYIEKYGLDETLGERFLKDCEEMKQMHVDITMPSHPAHFDLFERKPEDPLDYRPFVNESDWEAFLESRIEFTKNALSK
jgi:metallo-beta-lactamase class B